jgi:hypothetical protein
MPLESVESLRRLVDFYVRQHNEVMPHAAFEGQTPNEMYFGRGDPVVVKLAAARIRAREERIETNRNSACGVLQVGPQFGSVAAATPPIQNVVRRSRAMRQDAASLTYASRRTGRRREFSDCLARRFRGQLWGQLHSQ